MMIYWTSSYGITDGQNGVLTNGTDENYIPLWPISYAAYFICRGHNNRIFDCKNDYFHMIKCVFNMAACGLKEKEKPFCVLTSCGSTPTG